MKKSIFGIFIISLFLITTGAVCSKTGKMPEKYTLNFWGPEYEKEDLESAISAFEAKYPYVTVSYKKYNYDEYDEMLLNSWAKGQGPDIFSLPNSQVKKYYDLITPLPASVSVTTVETKTTFTKKETLINTVSQKSISVQELKNQYIETVGNDAIFPHKTAKETKETDKIFGLPLDSDTLALYYNRDILNQAGITTAAANWQDIVEHTKLITKIDKDNNILQSGIALGTAGNINNYFDIVSVLMMQYGSSMSDGKNIYFDQTIKEEDRAPGQQALDFYVKFAKPDWETYTWNDKENNALEAFAEGKVAYYIGYHRDLKTIKQLAPGLNFDIALLPQINSTNKVNYASYWLNSVSVNSKHSDMAWAFIQYLTNEENSKKYLEAAAKPASRRALLASQEENYELAVFSEQALTAKSWYRGKDPQEAQKIFSAMINEAIAGTFPIEDIVGKAAGKMKLTMQ